MTDSIRKKGSKKIRRFLDELHQGWWADYLFHFTDIRNAASILESGYLLSRNEAKRKNPDFTDAACSKVIYWTKYSRPKLLDYVRFYFRPFNATTYIMEGFKPGSEAAHCPVPVYLLFDIREIITCKKTRFSDGNLASKDSTIFSKAKEFRKLDFDLIYNERNEFQSKKFKRARQAEVIYPERVSLKHLKCIRCRSSAEYETLKNLLPSDTWSIWEDRVKYTNSHQLFNKFWLHVEEVKLSKESIDILFNAPCRTEDYGPFEIHVSIEDTTSEKSYYFKHQYKDIVSELENQTLVIAMQNARLLIYRVKIVINDELAYLGRYNLLDEITF